MNDVNHDQSIDEILRLAPYLTVLSHVQGKIVLQFKLSALTELQKGDLHTLISSIPGIVNVKIRLLSRSVVVEYDPDQIPVDLLESLFQQRRTPDQLSYVHSTLKGLLGS